MQDRLTPSLPVIPEAQQIEETQNWRRWSAQLRYVGHLAADVKQTSHQRQVEIGEALANLSRAQDVLTNSRREGQNINTHDPCGIEEENDVVGDMPKDLRPRKHRAIITEDDDDDSGDAGEVARSKKRKRSESKKWLTGKKEKNT